MVCCVGRGGGGPEGGSVLNAGQSAVRALVATSLRHWAQEFLVDGFVFVNAENLAQVSMCGAFCLHGVSQSFCVCLCARGIPFYFPCVYASFFFVYA